MSRIVSWFSCGAASAVATKLAIKKYGQITIGYTDTASEHPDNLRFMKDCEKWFGQSIAILKNAKYYDIWDVFSKTRYIVGVNGARCTTELKKQVRRDFEQPDDTQVFGFTAEEKDRADRFRENNIEVKLETPLIEANLSKSDCLALLREASIELPAMYKLGYRNNNCIGCVKGQSGYWNKIRIDFPDVFNRMAKVEREIGATINKRYEGKKRIPVYLDELPPQAGRYEAEPDIECGLLCQIAKHEMDSHEQ